MDSFLYDRDIRHERVQQINADQKYRKEKDLTKIFSKKESRVFLSGTIQIVH